MGGDSDMGGMSEIRGGGEMASSMDGVRDRRCFPAVHRCNGTTNGGLASWMIRSSMDGELAFMDEKYPRMNSIC